MTIQEALTTLRDELQKLNLSPSEECSLRLSPRAFLAVKDQVLANAVAYIEDDSEPQLPENEMEISGFSISTEHAPGSLAFEALLARFDILNAEFSRGHADGFAGNPKSDGASEDYCHGYGYGRADAGLDLEEIDVDDPKAMEKAIAKLRSKRTTSEKYAKII